MATSKQAKTAKTDNTCAVTFTAVLNRADLADKLYICGNDAKLGGWNAEKAVALTKKGEGTFSKSIKLEKGSKIEFKILKAKCWDSVEKGMFGEEIVNHTVVADDKAEKQVVVYNFEEK